MKLIDKESYDEIWDRIYSEYSFKPSFNTKNKNWLQPKVNYKRFILGNVWNENQHSLVNEILCKSVGTQMLALDWQHDCFIFNPDENIPIGYSFYDKSRNCNVCFPEYYPDGDYYFFIAENWSAGIFGNPWQKELIVIGEELIKEFEKHSGQLNINIED